MDGFYRQVMVSFNILSTTHSLAESRREEQTLIDLYNEMGQLMQNICKEEKGIHVLPPF